MKTIRWFAIALLIVCFVSSAALAETTPAGNPMAYVTTDAQAASLCSLVRMDDEGFFYTMDYTADYKLDEFLAAGLDDAETLLGFILQELLAGEDMQIDVVKPSCSAFMAKTPDGGVLYGRNFDYNMSDMSAVLVRTEPEDGYASIGLVDTGWISLAEGSLDDGETDISVAVALPYMMIDGMNEKGVAISMLMLDGDPARQDTGKTKISTSVAMRLVLDRAATVDEAVDLLREYDMQSVSDESNFHFLISDATGRTIVLEYCPDDMYVMEQTYATNFYLHPTMNELGGGVERYEVLRAVLKFHNSILTERESLALLELISRPPVEDDITSMTQWSVLYNLTDLDLTLTLLQDFSTFFSFSLDDLTPFVTGI